MSSTSSLLTCHMTAIPITTQLNSSEELEVAAGNVETAKAFADTLRFMPRSNPFKAKSRVMDRLGVGISLYFRISEFLVYLSFVGAALGGIAMFWNAEFGSRHFQIKEWFSSICLGNYYALYGDAPLQIIVDSLYTIIFAIGFIILRFNIKRWTKKIDKRTLTAGRFSMHVRHLPRDALDPTEIANFFAPYGKIVDVAIVLDSKKLCDFSRDRAKAICHIKRHALMNMSGVKPYCAFCHRSTLRWQHYLSKSERNIEKVLGKKVLGTGHAFVTFEHSNDADVCILAYSSRPFRSFFRPYFRGKHRLYCETAPEPRDVQWENFKYTALNRFTRRLISIVISLTIIFTWIMVLLGIGALVVLIESGKLDGFNIGGIAFMKELTQEPQFNRLLGWGTSLAVWITNKLIFMLLKAMSKFEKHLTITGTTQSQTWRLIMLQTLNSTIIVLALHFTFDSSEFYAAGGGASIALNILILMAFGDPVLKLLKVFLHAVKCRSTWYRVKVKRRLSPEDLESYFSPPTFPLLHSYTRIAVFIFVALFFSSSVPLALPLCFIGFFVGYWIDKYLVLRYYRKPSPVGSRIAETVSSSFKYSILAHCIAAIWFYRYAQVAHLVTVLYNFLSSVVSSGEGGGGGAGGGLLTPSDVEGIFLGWVSLLTLIGTYIILYLTLRWAVSWMLCLPLLAQNKHRTVQRVKVKKVKAKNGEESDTVQAVGLVWDDKLEKFEPPISHTHITISDINQINKYVSRAEAVRLDERREIWDRRKQYLKAEANVWDRKLHQFAQSTVSAVRSVADRVILNVETEGDESQSQSLSQGLATSDPDMEEEEEEDVHVSRSVSVELADDIESSVGEGEDEGPLLWVSSAWHGFLDQLYSITGRSRSSDPSPSHENQAQMKKQVQDRNKSKSNRRFHRFFHFSQRSDTTRMNDLSVGLLVEEEENNEPEA